MTKFYVLYYPLSLESINGDNAHLGITIDCSLKWCDHISYIYNKLVKFTSIFYKIRSKLTPDVLRMIYFAFVHPLLLYGIEVYANTTMNHLISLRTLN